MFGPEFFPLAPSALLAVLSALIPVKQAYSYALDLLAARAYSTQQLRRKLRQKEYEPADVDAVIERLTSSGLLDDAKYASEFARQRLVSGGSSVRRVQQDLARKGIDRTVATDAVDSVVEEESVDVYESLERIARKKVLSMGDLEPEVKRRRLFGFLARKGYELDDIKTAVDQLLP